MLRTGLDQDEGCVGSRGTTAGDGASLEGARQQGSPSQSVANTTVSSQAQVKTATE
jgi:hypothetical protein